MATLPVSTDCWPSSSAIPALANIGSAVNTENFDDHVWQAEDAVTWTHGRHTFKFGGQFNHEIIKTFYAGNNGELGYHEL